METIAENTAPRSAANGELRKRRDRDLQVARRVDWRYLLPDPRLREVGYVGRQEGMLREALEQLCESVAVAAPAEKTQAGQKEFDVVVLKSRERAELETASAMLSVGGHLYWEVEGGRKRPAIQSCVAWLKEQGFDGIKAHWNRPGFENCLEIIPLGETPALTFVLARHFGGVRRRLMQTAGRAVTKMRMLEWMMPSVSIVARKKGQSSERMNAVEEFLSRNWERLELGEGGRKSKLSSIVATPAFRASRHAVFLIFANGTPELSWVAKTARLAEETSSLDREVKNLRALHAVRPGGFASAPRVLAYETQWGSRLLVESAVD